MPKIINNDDFECVLGTPPPKQTTQPFHGHNLPPEDLQPQTIGGSTTQSSAGKKSKPLDFEDPDDFLIAVNEIIQKRKDQENGRELAIQAAQKELGGVFSTDITEQDMRDMWERGKMKDTPELIAAIEKEMNDPNMSEERREYYKKLCG